MHASILPVVVAGAFLAKSKSHLKPFSIETVLEEFAQNIKSDSPHVGTELMGRDIKQDLPCAVAEFDPLYMICSSVYSQVCFICSCPL